MKSVVDYAKKNKLLLLVILPAFFSYLSVIFPSGSYYCFGGDCGIYFFGAQGRDAIWHLAIIENSFNKIPFVNPVFSGEKLYGYNWLLDWLIFLLTKLGMSSVTAYFRFLPIVWFILFTFLLIFFARKIKNNPLFVMLFLLLSYFAGSFSYLLTLFHTGSIKGSSLLFPQPVIHMMSNLSYAFSLLLFLPILIILKAGKLNFQKIIHIGVCLFLIMGLKFYGGAISVFLVFTYVILSNISQEAGMIIKFKYLLIISLSVIAGLLFFYDPLRSLKTGQIFGFSPFALVHTITESPNLFYLRGLTNARYFIQAQGKIGPRLIVIESLNLFLFLFFYLGTRFFGFFYTGFLLVKKKLDKFDTAVISAILFSILLTVMLVQKGVWWNTIQFLFYAIFLLTIYLAEMVFNLIKTGRIQRLLIGVLLILSSVPTSYDLAFHQRRTSPVFIPTPEIEALKFLKKLPEGIVFISNREELSKNINDPIPLSNFQDSSYIAAFTGKRLYFAEAQTLGVMGVDYKQRLQRIKKKDCTVLEEVGYVYEIRNFPKVDKILARCKPKNSKIVFKNESVIIYSMMK